MVHPVDEHVGKCIRLRRRLLEMTQTQLASKADISFQQIQKYETGFNRVSASRMVQLADIFGCSVSSFFDGLQGNRHDLLLDILDDKETVRFVTLFNRIPEQQRRRFFELAKALAD